MCRAIHDEEHAQALPPTKPNKDEMLSLMNKYEDKNGL